MGKNRSSSKRRRELRVKFKRQLIENNPCAYCGGVATTVDHVIPKAAGASHYGQSNLVPSCRLCNQIAGDKVFTDFTVKRQWIRERCLLIYDEISLRKSDNTIG